MADSRNFGALEPLGRPWGITHYWGLVAATPLARCTGCQQIVLYRTAVGEMVTAERCPCTETTDG